MTFIIVDKLPAGKTGKRYYGGVHFQDVLWMSDLKHARVFDSRAEAARVVDLLRTNFDVQIANIEQVD